MGRSYTDRDLKLLWGAAARCAFPGCKKKLIVPATENDEQQVIGIISHIVAHSDNGPRGDPNFPSEDRDKPENLILLCGTHHDMVDVQPNSYSPGDLLRWKTEHETWVDANLSDAVVALTFGELEAVASALVASVPPGEQQIDLPTPPARKMSHNGLSAAIAHYYRIGQLRFADVERFISDSASWDLDFGERLKAGFQTQYEIFWERGRRGDDLYIALANWSSGGPLAEFPRQAAGVAILSYLFHVCDVFEPEPSNAASD
jgi:hypothetical protein